MFHTISLTNVCQCERLLQLNSLLLSFRLFSFVFCCETMAWDSVATLWKK